MDTMNTTYNLWPETTTGQTESPCPHCSTNATMVFHAGGPCPRIKAKEYYPNGSLKRIEYVQWKQPDVRITPLGEPIWTSPDFDEPMEFVFKSELDALRRRGEFELEEDTLLPAGRYTMIDHELRLIKDEAPPDSIPLSEDAGILKMAENKD